MKSSVNVIYHDNHLLVLDKPAGLSTQPHGGDSLEERGKAWVKETYQKPGKVFLTPVHRLDKAVSGLVLFARTSKALSRLQEQMRAREIHKTYYARIEGHLSKKKGTLKNDLTHGNHRAKVVLEGEGKEALLNYIVMQEEPEYSIVEIELLTGRYHQIRAQFAHIKHPICGDAKYGSKVPSKAGEIALVHGKLTCVHPVKQESITLRSSFVEKIFSFR